jgi:hypothetical protein
VYERYMICDETLRNVPDSDGLAGFAFDIRIAYYRGVVLSMIDALEVTVDGETFDRDALTFVLRDRAYSLDDLLIDDKTRWEFGERASIHVDKPGGLGPGDHVLGLAQELRIAYMPGARLRGEATKAVTVA